VRRWLRWTLIVIVAVTTLVFGSAWLALRASLPELEGKLPAAGLVAAATIERDARGVPVITAANRADLAYALGFAHGQDRFFQMDLSRRFAAGELSELFGAVALAQDKRARRFNLRAVARQIYASATAEDRAIGESYAKGVNAGLESLGARPFEYLVLRGEPRAWAPEDTALVVHSMWWQLQYATLTAEIERRRFERAAAQKFGADAGALVHFLYPGHTRWDTPNYGDGPCAEPACQNAVGEAVTPLPKNLKFAPPDAKSLGERLSPGSNSWAVAGRHSASGAALIANDMHLDLGVPIVWYPTRLVIPGEGAAALDITGVSLPGTPAIAAGSNGHVAWGFTNSYGDFADVRWVDCARADWRVRHEEIRVKGAEAAHVEYRDSEFGTRLDGDDFAADEKSGRCLEAAWLVTRPEATNLNLLGMERARSIDDVLALAPSVGVPGQNLVVGDAQGRIAWVLLGRVARETGPDRYFGPVTWRDASDHPHLVDPPIGRLWTANQRVVGGALEVVVGDDEVDVGAGGYDLGARARQIRDGLLQLPRLAKPADMHAIQVDDRALFLATWREALLNTLDAKAVEGNAKRAEFRRLVESWDAHAGADSVGYRLVRTWRVTVFRTLWRSAVVEVAGADFAGRPTSLFEGAVWRLITEQPGDIAPPVGADWRAFLLDRVDAAIGVLEGECGALSGCTHGSRRPVEVRHPLSRAIPGLRWLLDMPTYELAGDNHLPRVQDGSFGASERFAVSPGHEAEGYLELPGGPSGHPLSPYYRSGYDEWAQGRATPFLPGPAAHRLVLEPN
jgi:penicillin amidase